MSAYYNEVCPEKAEWIRELIKANVIAPGEVDERSITDVQPDDLRGFVQCHFFAGIGVWSYALRLAGWEDTRPVWTGSCPCPSFSCAGKGTGFNDPRHLWPAWFDLIRQCRPRTVFGEQVMAAVGHGWWDLVCGNMEAEKYALAAVGLGAHSSGSPHIRQRLYFVGERGDATGRGQEKWAGQAVPGGRSCGQAERSGDALGSANTQSEGFDGIAGSSRQSRSTSEQERRQLGWDSDVERRPDTPDARRNDPREHGSGSPLFAARPEQRGIDGRDSAVGDGSDTGGQGLQERQRDGGIPRQAVGTHTREAVERPSDPIRAYANRIGATRGFWADCDWWYGKDGKYRPIGRGITPLVSGTAKSSVLQMASISAADLRLVRDLSETEPESGEARVLRLRGYGDAICAETAKVFIEAYQEVRGLK